MRVLDENLQETEGKSKEFILRSVDPSSINHNGISYLIGSCFPPTISPRNIEVLKSSFTMFACTPLLTGILREFEVSYQ